MKRDIATGLIRARVSSRASARFFGLVDVIGRGIGPTQTQLEALDSAYRSTGEFLVAAPEFDGLLLEVFGHGSRQMGTLVRPMDESREGFDVDGIARLHRSAIHRYEGPDGPGRLLTALHTVAQRYASKHGLKVRRWERCVTLEYSGGMCADLAPVIDEPRIAVPFGDTHGRIPDRALKLYDATNPRGYLKFFDQAAAISPMFTEALQFADAMLDEARAQVTPLPDAEEVFERLLCRLVQLLKLNRNVAFGRGLAEADASPTSVFITTLAAKAYAAQAPLPHHGPLDLLQDIVQTLPDHFDRIRQPDGSEFWYLQNPAVPTDNLAAGMNTILRQKGFDWWHARVVEQLNGLLTAIERQAGLDVVVRHVEEAFGERAAKLLQAQQAHGRAASRIIGHAALIPATGIAIHTPSRAHTFYGAA